MIKDTHLIFLDKLEQSKKAHWAAAFYLWECGYQVRMPPMKKAPSRDVWHKYSDKGDIFIKMNGKPEALIDVKGLTADFTIGDWPFKDVIVTSQGSWDRANPKPDGFMYVNKALTHYARLKPNPKSQIWHVETRWNSVIRENCSYYVTSKKHITFHELKATPSDA